MKLSEIASRIDAEVDGVGDIEILGVAGLEYARPGMLTFLSNPKYARKVARTRASAVILATNAPKAHIPALRVADPYVGFAQALALFYALPRPSPGVHPTAVVAATARIGAGSSIGPHVVVEEDVVIGARACLRSHVTVYCGARIGDDFLAHSHAVVREYCRIGNRVTLQNGAIVGADGFGFARRADGSYLKIVQAGIVVVEDDVEIQALTCVDRATVGETVIRRGAKLDNLVQVGHGCVVGEDSLLCAQVGLAGSTTLGKNVILAGQVGVAGHLTIGDGSTATAQSGVPGDVPPRQSVSGSPAVETSLRRRTWAALNRLPHLLSEFRTLRSRIESLERNADPVAERETRER